MSFSDEISQIDQGLYSPEGFQDNFNKLIEQSRKCGIVSADDPFFSVYEMNNILHFTLTGQITFICLMNAVRCNITEQQKQVYGGLQRDVNTEHKALSQCVRAKGCKIQLVNNEFQLMLLKNQKQKAIVGLVAGDNSHCKQPKLVQYNEPFQLRDRLQKVMSRCHNADILTITSFIPALSSLTQVPDRPQVINCKVIRDARGSFINGCPL